MRKRKIFLCKNLVAGVAGVVFGAAMFLASGTKSGIYPKILFACMVFLGVYILAEIGFKGQGTRLGRVSVKEILGSRRLSDAQTEGLTGGRWYCICFLLRWERI